MEQYACSCTYAGNAQMEPPSLDLEHPLACQLRSCSRYTVPGEGGGVIQAPVPDRASNAANLCTCYLLLSCLLLPLLTSDTS